MALFWRRPETPFEVRGLKRSIGGDWYHLMLRAPWWFNLLSIACGFLVINVMFAFLYLQVGGVAGAHGFAELFFFSVQTMGTIGYGSMYPVSMGAHILTTFEAIAGIFVVALATGLLFSKFSMLRARVRFASSAVVSAMNGIPTLMIRIGHERSSSVMDALIRVVFSRLEKTAEGVEMYRMYDLKLERDRAPALSRAWTVLHVISDKSPLYGFDAASLTAVEGEFLLTLSGVDETSGQMLHARHTYEDIHVKWGERHADMLTRLPEGRLLVDMEQFDRTLPVEKIDVKTERADSDALERAETKADAQDSERLDENRANGRPVIGPMLTEATAPRHIPHPETLADARADGEGISLRSGPGAPDQFAPSLPGGSKSP